jgi:hypothetical protein
MIGLRSRADHQPRDGASTLAERGEYFNSATTSPSPVINESPIDATVKKELRT